VITVRTADPGSTFDATSRCSDCSATSTVAPESASNPVSSRCLFIGLIGTAIPPAFHAPICATTNCGTFCAKIATRSPGENPSAAIPAANASDSSSSSVKLIRRSKYRIASPRPDRATVARNIARAESYSGVIDSGCPAS
jgi:hypothetical protein